MLRSAAKCIHMDQKKAPCCFWALVALTHTANLLQDYLDAGVLLGETKEPHGYRTILTTCHFLERELQGLWRMNRERRYAFLAPHAAALRFSFVRKYMAIFPMVSVRPNFVWRDTMRLRVLG